MLVSWAETGRSVAEFWTLTPAQIAIVFKGESRRVKRETELAANLATYQVWRLAHFMRVKKLPNKPDNLLKSPRRRSGTGDDWKMQKAALETFNAAIGGFDNRKKE